MNNAIIFAGGVGSRMRTHGLPKQFLVVFGKPIIVHTLEHFEHCGCIEHVVVVCKKEFIHRMRQLVEEFHFRKIYKIVEGGETGQESIWNGLTEIYANFPTTNNVVIHDGVRPFISPELIDECVKVCEKEGNAVAASRAIETVSVVKKNQIVDRIEKRENCFVLKAPQCFKFSDIYEAHLQAKKLHQLDFIDSASMVKQLLNQELHIVECDKSNIKVTTPEDFYILRALFESREVFQIMGVN